MERAQKLNRKLYILFLRLFFILPAKKGVFSLSAFLPCFFCLSAFLPLKKDRPGKSIFIFMSFCPHADIKPLRHFSRVTADRPRHHDRRTEGTRTPSGFHRTPPGPRKILLKLFIIILNRARRFYRATRNGQRQTRNAQPLTDQKRGRPQDIPRHQERSNRNGQRQKTGKLFFND